jgi:hypothetical protein
MADKVLEIIIGIVGLLIPIIWVVEIVLSATWQKNYFTIGVPIFVFRIPVEAQHTNIPSCPLLESNFKSSGFIRNTSLLFEEIEPNLMGFRESLLQFGRWYSVMHGSLIFDTKNSQVIVKGFLDWAISYFSLLWIIGAPLFWLLGFERDEPIWLALLVYSILFINLGVFCSLDYIRFSRVAKFAAQAWSRHYATIVSGV